MVQLSLLGRFASDLRTILLLHGTQPSFETPPLKAVVDRSPRAVEILQASGRPPPQVSDTDAGCFAE
jgi:hypothetical protein